MLSAGLQWLSYTATQSKKVFHFLFYVNPVITSKYDFGIYKYKYPFTRQDLNSCCLGVGGREAEEEKYGLYYQTTSIISCVEILFRHMNVRAIIT